MPFRLIQALADFQLFINDTSLIFLDIFAYTYLDDISYIVTYLVITIDM
jgi:hypothetical protein